MAKIGSTKVCKARVSTTDKKKCDTRFTVNHKKQKFCSPRCRNRNDRITKSDIRKKEQRQAQIELKQKEYLLTFKGKVDTQLQGIRGMYSTLLDYKNIKYPVLEDRDKYDFKLAQLHENLMNQAKAKEMEGKTKIPRLMDAIKRDSMRLGYMVANECKKRKGNEAREKDLNSLLYDIYGLLDRDYYKEVPVLKYFSNALANSIKDESKLFG